MASTPSEAEEDEPFERAASADRLIAFTDAVVAIAMTLLVLPLMESVAAVTDKGAEPHIGDWLVEHHSGILNFVVSFVIVAFYWFMHHRVVEQVRSFSNRMSFANFVWLFSIVLLPVTTAMSVAFVTDGVQASVYIGALVLLIGSLLWLQVEIVRHPESGASWKTMRRSIATAIASLILVLVAWPIIAFTPLKYFGMMVLLFVPLLTSVIARFMPAGDTAS
ncbi:TMEM175 family protein [Cutibacterium equinum]|uniref:TMEM175 family protein n=1 Tax=Cutibacterium equinum TaxID=3016342 RepID=A0ABY7R082_9ACTN|nr:TMEM175 family protein [Cutibacterium equinum]WCC80370.1 TMEM175 family protein [Cutibacterium equinum]